MRRIKANGSFDLLLGVIKSFEPGALFVYSDFAELVEYGCARSSLERLCKLHYVSRVSPGVFVKLNDDGSSPEADIVKIAEAISRKTGSTATPHIKTINAIESNVPINEVKWVFSTTGSSRKVRLLNGIVIYFRHKA